MKTGQASHISPPPANVPQHAGPGALRWLFPLAGGGVGLWRGGVRLGLSGAALGLLLARIWRKRAKRPLRDPGLKSGAANHLATHLDAVVQRTIESLRAD